MSDQAALIDGLGFDPSEVEGKTVKRGLVEGDVIGRCDGAAPMVFPDGVTLFFTDGSEVCFRMVQYSPDEAAFCVSATVKSEEA